MAGTPTQKIAVAIIGGEFFLKIFLWLVYAIFFFVLLFSGGAKPGVPAPPFVSGFLGLLTGMNFVFAGIVIFFLIPACILMAIKATRNLGAILAMFLVEFALFTVLCMGATTAYNTLGVAGLIGGTLLVGYGVVVVGLVGLLIHGAWANIFQILLVLIPTLILRFIARCILSQDTDTAKPETDR